MKKRCYNKTASMYKHYGGRGIKICERWRISFNNFLEDMGTKPNSKYSLERLNVNGDYEPNNCKWIPKKEQARNRTDTKTVLYKGVTKKVVELAEEYNMNSNLILSRLKQNWSIEKALTTPVQKRASQIRKMCNS